MDWDEHGIPGHAAKSAAARLLQERLRQLGVSFEAEGDTTRVHVSGVIVEAKDDPELGLVVQVQAPLPRPGDDPGDAAAALAAFARAVAVAPGEARYAVEEPVPGYPSIVAVIPVPGQVEQAEAVLRIVEELAGGAE